MLYFFMKSLKVNKSVYIAKSRQRYHKTLNNILLHVSNHALKDMYMLNYGTKKCYSSTEVVIDFINPLTTNVPII